MNTLPDKPSELILVALRDLELVEKDPQYRIYMGSWHAANNAYGGKCEVCLAGSVMAKSLDVPRYQDCYPERLDGLAGKLRAINDFREGHISSGLHNMGLKLHWYDSRVKVSVPRYEDSPKRFKAALRKIAKTFRSLGL